MNKFETFLSKFKKILVILKPHVPIGGLEISDSDLRFVFIDENKLFLTSLKLPVGIVKEGKIQDADNFKLALAKLHSQITPKTKKKIYVVVNIGDINTYAQIFNLPMVATNNLEEAVKLNLQMISPAEFSSVYADWQKLGENNTDGGQLEILGAFVSKQISDEFTRCLKEKNFIVAAVEFSGLAISRLLPISKDVRESFLLLRLGASGLSFNLIRNQQLYFNHFVSWSVEEQRQISLASLKAIIIQETQKVLNFANNHWPEVKINKLLLATPALDEKISQIITENFPLTVEKLVLAPKLSSADNHWLVENNQLPQISAEWFGALGSALRGLIPRSKDIIISLISPGTEEEFRQYQIISFIKIWRNIILTVFSFVLIIFIATEGFFIENSDSLKNQLSNLTNLPELEEITKLQQEAKEFNAKIEMALKAKSEVSHWSGFFEKIKTLAGNDIVIERILIQSEDMPIFLNGQADNESAVIDFKNKMAGDAQYQNVNLPLSGITQTAGGKFKFGITFTFSK